jgi:hypothetical protein
MFLRRRRRWELVGVTAAILAAWAWGGPARAAGEASRQSGEITFSATTPATPTGLDESAHYVNPTDPAAKPPPVVAIETAFAPGFGIDTSVPERCTVPDAVLLALGGRACPAGSRVGSGAATLATGLPGPAGIVALDLEVYNGADQAIFLSILHGTGVAVDVIRASFANGMMSVQLPPTPGGPPDGRSSLKDIHFSLTTVTTSQNGHTRSYLTTPPRCPPSRQWVSRSSFTYTDGVTQTLAPTTPCQPHSPTSAQARSQAAQPAAAGAERSAPSGSAEEGTLAVTGFSSRLPIVGLVSLAGAALGVLSRRWGKSVSRVESRLEVRLSSDL